MIFHRFVYMSMNHYIMSNFIEHIVVELLGSHNEFFSICFYRSFQNVKKHKDREDIQNK